MRNISPVKIILLTVCLLATGLLVHSNTSSDVAPPKAPLHRMLNEIKGWQPESFAPLDEKIIQMLKLDDYINLSFRQGDRKAFLYIGYYRSGKKVGAAHDPLVCFPGQGWRLKDRSTRVVDIKSLPKQKVRYASMVAELGSRRELVVYWFQSFDATCTDTFSQKIHLLWNKLRGQGQDNAFVRITVPVEDQDLDESHEVALNFIQKFYPAFLGFIQG